MLWNEKFQPNCTNTKIFYKPHSTSQKKARLWRSTGGDKTLYWCDVCAMYFN